MTPEEEHPSHRLLVPFTVVESVGGPYDDAAFCAGFTVGAVHASLAALSKLPSSAEFSEQVRSDLVDQLDLVAMHHGWTTSHSGDDGSGWTTLQFHPPVHDLPDSDPRIAAPGDEDLDFDIAGMTLDAYTSLAGSFVLSLSGGSGWWLDPDGTRCPIDTMTDCEVTLSISEPASVAWLEAAFARWSVERTPLHMTSAPDRLSRLAASPTDWLALPRWPFPTDHRS